MPYVCAPLLLVPLAAPSVASHVAPSLPSSDHLAAVTSDLGRGNLARLELAAPWTPTRGLEPLPADAIARAFDGLLHVVGPEAATVQVLDPATYEPRAVYSVGSGTRPRDILVVEPTTAYVSREGSAELLIVDPRSGARKGAVDLAPLADSDGLPEMRMLARDGFRLFVQLANRDRISGAPGDRPPALAVVDVRTAELVDVDPDAPGVQGIELVGASPDHAMQIEGRRLYVSATGEFLEPGGIEEVDLDALASNGLVAPETFAEISAFVMVSPTLGYALTHTDFTASTHVTAFARVDGGLIAELHVTFGIVHSLAYDPLSGQLFFPDPVAGGVRVFDAASMTQLTTLPIATGLAPRHVVLVRAPSDPNEVRDLLRRTP